MKDFLAVVAKVADRMNTLCHEPVWMETKPPAREEEVRAVESELGYRLPDELRSFFLNCSSSLMFLWHFDWDFTMTLPEALRDATSGGMCLCLQDQPACWVNWAEWDLTGVNSADSPNGGVRYQFPDLHPFEQAANGDTLLLVRRGPNQGAVLMVGFETTELWCARLAPSFGEFLDLWSKLAFVGPEEAALRIFYDRVADMLSLTCAEAGQWQRICGLETRDE